MTRFRASSIHLAISASVVAAILSIVFLFWYPGWTFEIAGAMRPVFVLVGVDLVVGPLLTLIIYKQGKPGLLFDLWFIALVQITALVYGTYTLNAGRPHYMVFSVDRIGFDLCQCQARLICLHWNMRDCVSAVFGGAENP